MCMTMSIFKMCHNQVFGHVFIYLESEFHVVPNLWRSWILTRDIQIRFISMTTHNNVNVFPSQLSLHMYDWQKLTRKLNYPTWPLNFYIMCCLSLSMIKYSIQHETMEKLNKMIWVCRKILYSMLLINTIWN